MKILFVTDLHGSTLVFKKTLLLASQADVDLVIVGGDLSGKRMLPIIPSGSLYRSGEPYKQKDDSGKSVETMRFESIAKGELGEYYRRLESKGYYWHVADEHEIQRLNECPTELNELFRQKIFDRIMEWADLASRRLPDGMLCLWTGGNDDESELLDMLTTADLGRFVYAEGRVMPVEEFEVISLGYSNETPFETARELTERDLLMRLEELAKKATTTERLLVNVHVPPKDCGKLDLVVTKDGDILHVGSEGVRTFIENFQPLADFAGHVHEGQGAATIGRTHIFNPGSDYNSGVLQAFIVTLSGCEVVDYVHVTR